MDTLSIRGLEIATVIGCHDWERTIEQTVVLDIEMATDITAAAVSDSIDDVPIDYAAVVSRLREFVGAGSFLLIETLAARVTDLLMKEFAIPWVRLELSKPRPRSGYSSVLTIERGDRPSNASDPLASTSLQAEGVSP